MAKTGETTVKNCEDQIFIVVDNVKLFETFPYFVELRKVFFTNHNVFYFNTERFQGKIQKI